MTWQVVKTTAIVSMTLDHASKTFLTQQLLVENLGMSLTVSFWLLHAMEALGRIAFPLYAFGIAQGCTYTKSRGKFLLRLLVFAVLSEVPFQLALRWGTVRLRLWPLPISNVLFTLLFGALCCFIWDFFRRKKLAWVDQEDAAAWVSISLIFLASLLTGLGVFDSIAKRAGAGTLVPITGFSNAMVSPALEFKSEGFVTGTGSKLFTVAGPVLAYGISASVVYGIILYIVGLF